MPDQSASPADERSWWAPESMSAEQAEFLRHWCSPQMTVKATRMVVDDRGVALSVDDTLRCRDQALYCATQMFDTSPFPEDAERVIEIAKRFESYIRTGE